jgi:hypothetical protein
VNEAQKEKAQHFVIGGAVGALLFWWLHKHPAQALPVSDIVLSNLVITPNPVPWSGGVNEINVSVDVTNNGTEALDIPLVWQVKNFRHSNSIFLNPGYTGKMGFNYMAPMDEIVTEGQDVTHNVLVAVAAPYGQALEGVIDFEYPILPI